MSSRGLCFVVSVFLISLFSASYLSSISFLGADSAYQLAFNASYSWSSFPVFVSLQGYPCLPLWLYYLSCNFLKIDFLTSEIIQSTFYLFTATIFPFALLQPRNSVGYSYLLYYILFTSFFCFGYFGLVVVLSATKMLFALAFFFLFYVFWHRGNLRLWLSFSLLSLSSHFSIVVLYVVVFLPFLIRYSLTAFRALFSKAAKNSLANLLLYIVSGFLLVNLYNSISAKLIYYLSGSGDNTSSSYFSRISIVYAAFALALRSSRSLSGFNPLYLLLVLPIFFDLPFGRLSWLFLMAIYFPSSVSKDLSLAVGPRYLFLLLVPSVFYFLRGVDVLRYRDLMF